MLHCHVALKLLLISDAFNRNDFQRMEGEVEIEMAASIARSRAIFDEAYIRLRQTHPSLPVQLRDFQVSCILVRMCPDKKNIVPFFRLTSLRQLFLDEVNQDSRVQHLPKCRCLGENAFQHR